MGHGHSRGDRRRGRVALSIASYSSAIRTSHLQIGWIIAWGQEPHLPAVAYRPRKPRPSTRRTTMKTMILALAAVLSLAAGTAAMSPSAQAATNLYPPAQNGNG
jgi:hypothetical protein